MKESRAEHRDVGHQTLFWSRAGVVGLLGLISPVGLPGLVQLNGLVEPVVLVRLGWLIRLIKPGWSG